MGVLIIGGAAWFVAGVVLGFGVSFWIRTRRRSVNRQGATQMIHKRPEGLKLGDRAKDRISGFKGIVVAITEWLNSCRRITIQPEETKDGKPIDSHSFDAEQIELVLSRPKKPSTPTGGPSIAPARRTDPT